MIDDIQLEEVQDEVSRSGKQVSQILADLDIIGREDQLQLVAEYIGTMVVNLKDYDFPDELIKSIPAMTARMYQCLPLQDYGDALQVVLADPMNPSVVDELGFIIKKEIQ